MELSKEALEDIRVGINNGDREQWDVLTCYADKLVSRSLSKRGVELSDRDDVKNKVFIKIFTCIQTQFFMRTDYDNSNPENLNKWIYTIANNCIYDFKKTKNNNTGETIDKYENADNGGKTEKDRRNDLEMSSGLIFFVADQVDLFYAILSDVVFAKSVIYKVLSWMIFAFYFIESDKKVTARMEHDFEDISLFGMLEAVKQDIIDYNAGNAGQYSQQREKFMKKDWYTHLKNRLTDEYYENKPIGTYPYETFFMKKGGRATISDWINRANENIKKKFEKK